MAYSNVKGMMQNKKTKTLFSIFDFISISIIFIIALFLRLVYLKQYQHCPFFDSPVIDALSHYIFAKKMAAGDWLLKGFVTPRVPLYIYFLAGLFRLFGNGFFVAKVIQVVLGSINCLLVYFLGKKLFKQKVGLISGVVCAFYGVLIYFDAEFLSVVLTIFLNLILLFVIFNTLEKPKTWKWLISGIFFGICLQTSPNIILFLPLFCVYIYWCSNSQKQLENSDCLQTQAINKQISVVNQTEISIEQKIKQNEPSDSGLQVEPIDKVIKISKLNKRFIFNKKALKPLVFLCLGAFLSILPLSLRNLIKGGEFVMLSSTVGINLYIGNNSLADGMTAAPPSRDFSYDGWKDNVWVSSIKVARAVTGKDLNNSQISNYWLLKTGQFIVQHPIDFISLVMRKIYYLFNGYEIPENQSIYFFRLWSSLLAVLVFSNSFMSFPFGIIAPLALLGIFISWDKNNKNLMVMNCLILANLMVMVIFFVVSRYRAVLIPYFVIYAAYAGVWLFDKLSKNKIKSFLKYSAGFVILFIFCNSNLFNVTKDDKSRWFFNLGNAFRYQGQKIKAIKSYEQAYKINPDNLDVLYNIGVLHLENKHFNSAIKIFKQVLAKDSKDSAAYNNIGFALFKQGNYGQAIEYYNKALKLDPNDLGVMINLGSAYALLGRYDQAMSIFSQVIEIDPQFFSVYNHRAVAYELMGYKLLAEKDYLKAIELNSEYFEAYFNLAFLYKSQQRIEEYKAMHLKSLELISFE